MQFEIYLLEIVNEVYFRMNFDYEKLLKSAQERLDKKIRAFNDGTYTFTFAEFGCRRRLSREWEDVVVKRLATETRNCAGTSNVYLAKKHNLKPIGTYAHEFVQMSCVIGVPDSYKMQKVKAFVKLAPGVEKSDATKKAILEHCRKYVAKYAMPYDIEFREDLPKTLVGKVAYRTLEEEEAAKIAAAKQEEQTVSQS